MSRLLITVIALVLSHPVDSVAADPVAENRVTFYTTYGVPNDEGWLIPLRIWVHEKPDLARELLARAVRDELAERAGIDELNQEQKDRFMHRADGFIADSESREAVMFSFDDDPASRIYRLRDENGGTTTDRNGLIEGTITISREMALALQMAQGSDNGWLTLQAVSEDHFGVGRVRLIGARGVSIISDVDDTVKVTNIPSGEAEVLRNTFFREFKAAPCMADLYRSFDEDVSFHYVSGGPWQMYAPLAEFLFSAQTGFPEGSFHMKDVRTNPFESESYQDIWKLIGEGSEQATFEQKVRQISTLLRQYPHRQFILIGDSGERDPEVFAAIRKQFPEQVIEIRIRDVVNDARVRPERLKDMLVIPPAPAAEFDCQVLQGD